MLECIKKQDNKLKTFSKKQNDKVSMQHTTSENS